MKKLSKKWKIFITAMIVLVVGLYGVYKINNRNAFEEMYNSFYNTLPLSSVARMPQVEPLTRDQTERDIRPLNYKSNTNKEKIEITLVNFSDRKKVSITSSSYVSKEVYLDVTYMYEVDTCKLINYVSFRGENVPIVEDDQKQTRELLEKYNISKEYLQKNQTNY